MIKVKVYGQLTDITIADTLELGDCRDVAMVKNQLFNNYPLLKEKRFNIAIGNKIAQSDDDLVEGELISLLPPYSGG